MAYGLRHQNCSHSLTLLDRKWRLNGLELVESMCPLAPAGEVFLTPGVTTEVSQNHISCVGAK
jgi:hypothetical protein